MKRLVISSFLSLALLLVCLCCSACADAAQAGEHGASVPRCETEEHWEGGLRRVRMAYTDISPRELKAIVQDYRAKGLQPLPGTAKSRSMVLYRDDLWVEIADNTEHYRQCTISEFWGRDTASEGALSAREAEALIPAEGARLLERTPEGLFEATGAQVFCALVASPTADYEVSTWLVGRAQSVPLDACYYGEGLSCADLVGDGTAEIVLLGLGPSSGVFTETIAVYSLRDGIPWLRGSSVYQPPRGKTALVMDGGQLCYSHAPLSSFGQDGAVYGAAETYPIRLRSGWIELEGAAEEGFTLWGDPYYKRPDLPADTALELFLWEESGALVGHLRDAEGGDAHLFEWNSLAPYPAELLARELREEQGRPLQVYWLERPAREAPKELLGSEREAALARLGLTG